MSTSDNCKDSALNNKSNDGVCELVGKLQNMSTADDEDIIVSVCANCGKEGANNVCNKCNQVKYCNAVCKKVHKKKHKKQCDEHQRLAAEKHNEELRIAAELHDEKLFKEPPSQYGDCPICFVRLPTFDNGRSYKSCCGKVICSGCVYAPVYDNQGNEVDNDKCPFCRTPTPKTNGEGLERNKKRMEANDPIAIYNIGNYYMKGKHGYEQDYSKAIELWQRAGKLGYPKAYNNIGCSYECGRGVEVEKKKAIHYFELAAIGGEVIARYNLGLVEQERGNIDRALKHYTIAVRDGESDSLEVIKRLYSNGHASKEDYTIALQCYQAYLGEIKSDQRGKAAAADEENRYY